MKKDLFLRSLSLLLCIVIILLILIVVYSCSILKDIDLFYYITIISIMIVGLMIFLLIAIKKASVGDFFIARQSGLTKILSGLGAILICILALYSFLKDKIGTYSNSNDLIAIIFFGVGGLALFLLKRKRK